MNAAVWHEGMTLRRFLVLLRGLPGDSAWAAFLHDKEKYQLATYDPNQLSV